METQTSIQIAGLTVLAPVSVGTNLLLCVQCAGYCRRLRTGRADRSGLWALFFLAMAATTLAGALKHGAPHLMPPMGYGLVLWVCALGGGASVCFAQRATLLTHAGRGRGPVWDHGPAIQALVFLAACAVVGPEMWLVVVNTTVGLLPALAVETMAGRRGSSAGAWVGAGLTASVASALVYVGGLSLGRWFNHVDIAHVLMGLSFALIVRGGPADALPATGEIAMAAPEAA